MVKHVATRKRLVSPFAHGKCSRSHGPQAIYHSTSFTAQTTERERDTNKIGFTLLHTQIKTFNQINMQLTHSQRISPWTRHNKILFDCPLGFDGWPVPFRMVFFLTVAYLRFSFNYCVFWYIVCCARDATTNTTSYVFA